MYAGTDGDEGWLEVFDNHGSLIIAAFLDGDRVIWEDQASARGRLST